MKRSLVLLSFLALSGCGGDSPTDAQTRATQRDASPAQATPAQTPEPAATQTPEATTESRAPATDASDVGKTKTSGGIQITLLKVTSSRKLTYEGGTIDAEVTPKGNAVSRTAPQGGRYVYLRTQVTNKTSGGIDITCSGPIGASVYTDDRTQYDPVPSQYLIGDNPGCNQQLQPGFKDTMTWVFLVAGGVQATSFGFHDLTNPDTESEPAYFFFPPIPH